MTNHRPYRDINGKITQDETSLLHAIIGMVVVALLLGLMILLAGIYQPAPPAINDRAPALEKLEVVK